MPRLDAFGAVVGAPCGLAIDGDDVVPVRPPRRPPTRKAASEHNRIAPIDEFAQPALTRNAVMELREGAQEIETLPAPGANIFEIVATGDRRTDDQQHDLLERIHPPPRLPVIAKLGKMLQQNGQTCPRGLFV